MPRTENPEMRLIAIHSQDGWEGGAGSWEKYSPDRRKKFWLLAFDNEPVRQIQLCALNVNHGWSPLMQISQFVREDGSVGYGLGLDVVNNPGDSWPGRMVGFDRNGVVKTIGYTAAGYWKDAQDRESMLANGHWRYAELPARVDVPETSRLFLDQVLKGDFGKPVIIALGKSGPDTKPAAIASASGSGDVLRRVVNTLRRIRHG